MKNIIKKSITTIILFAMALTLAMPVTAQAAKKKAPKISKTKVTMTITKKKTNPAVQLKVKNVSAKNVKWATSNKKVATVSRNGKVIAKKKGNAVITVKVKGSKTLRCKVTVKDNRKPAPAPNGECEHNWVKKEKVVDEELVCSHGLVFNNQDEWYEHCDKLIEQGLDGCGISFNPIYKTYYECSKCHKTK